MSSPNPPDETDLEWALQERAREEERSSAPVAPGARLNRYRLISRVLHEPLAATLPEDFAVVVPAATGRHSAVLPRQRAILIATGIVYLAAMATAAFLMRADIGRAVAAFDGSSGLLAICGAVSMAAPRLAALIRLARRAPAPG